MGFPESWMCPALSPCVLVLTGCLEGMGMRRFWGTRAMGGAERSEARREAATSPVLPWDLSHTPGLLPLPPELGHRAAPRIPRILPRAVLRSCSSHCTASCLLPGYLHRAVSHLLGRQGHAPDVPHQQQIQGHFTPDFGSQIAFIFSEASDPCSWSSIWLGKG